MADLNLDATDSLRVQVSDVALGVGTGSAADSVRLRLTERKAFAPAFTASDALKVAGAEGSAPVKELIVATQRGAAVGTGSAVNKA